MVKTIFNMLKKKLLIKVMVIILPLLLLIIIACTVTILIINGQNNDNSNVNIESSNVSSQVLAWKPEVEKYAKQFGISQYENLILAIIQQESGGISVDVMQSSESAYNTHYTKVSNGITDPDYSIYCGVQELKEALTKAGVTGPNDTKNISLALQTYNFGEAFINYAKSNGGYSIKVAQEFSSMESQKNGGVSYGDINYSTKVLKYYISANINNGTGKLAKVVQIAEGEKGKEYVMGASGPDTFDCSGLVYYCYKNSGFKIQRLTAQGYYNGSTKTNTPEIGDLVFFGDVLNIHHIGIYVGNNQMIDAPSSNNVVKIQSYNWSDFAGFGKYNEK